METAFRDGQRADNPETYVLAWLALLQADDAPREAAALKTRLMLLSIDALSQWQRRLIELLTFVAGHRRRRPAGAFHTIQSLPTKGIR
ncbi:MAG: hypothetical protein AB7O43_17650 [Hyphomicrobiaceae bacterium]